MTSHDRSRRSAVLALVVACLIVVPAMAVASFSSTQAPVMSVSTERMETPAAVTGSYVCSSQGASETVRVDVTGFTDAGPAGASYVYRLAGTGGGSPVTATSTSKTQSLSTSKANDKDSTTWTLTIQSTLRGWTGTPSTTSVVCSRKDDNSGSL